MSYETYDLIVRHGTDISDYLTSMALYGHFIFISSEEKPEDVIDSIVRFNGTDYKCVSYDAENRVFCYKKVE